MLNARSRTPERNWLMLPAERIDEMRDVLNGATSSVTERQTAPAASSAAGY